MSRKFDWNINNSVSLITYKLLSNAAMGHYSEE